MAQWSVTQTQDYEGRWKQWRNTLFRGLVWINDLDLAIPREVDATLLTTLLNTLGFTRPRWNFWLSHPSLPPALLCPHCGGPGIA